MAEHIDIYCERTSPDFWAEPINAATNIGFLIAAFACWRLYLNYRSHKADRSILIEILVLNLGIIGIGSFLFHTFATYTAMMADVIPITIFMHLCLYLYLKRIFQLSILKTLIGLAVFIATSLAVTKINWGNMLNGSEGYITSLLTLFIFAFAMAKLGKPYAHLMSAAAIIFTFSIFFRFMDMNICTTYAFGTHFMWHILNAVTLYLLCKVLIISGVRYSPKFL